WLAPLIEDKAIPNKRLKVARREGQTAFEGLLREVETTGILLCCSKLPPQRGVVWIESQRLLQRLQLLVPTVSHEKSASVEEGSINRGRNAGRRTAHAAESGSKPGIW